MFNVNWTINTHSLMKYPHFPLHNIEFIWTDGDWDGVVDGFVLYQGLYFYMILRGYVGIGFDGHALTQKEACFGIFELTPEQVEQCEYNVWFRELMLGPQHKRQYSKYTINNNYSAKFYKAMMYKYQKPFLSLNQLVGWTKGYI